MSGFSQRARRPALFLTLAALLHGCAGNQAEDPGPAPEQPAAPDITGPAEPDFSLPASVHRGSFNAVETALAGFDWMTASVLLDELPEDTLSPEDAGYAAYLRARIDWVRGDSAGALASLDAAVGPGTSPALAHRAGTFRFFMLSLGGRPVEAAQAASTLLTTGPAAERPNWKRQTWRSLARADEASLRAALEESMDPEWLGWLQLALDARAAQPDLTTLLAGWRLQYPDHPAANPLPGGLDYVLDPGPAPDKAALLLPMSGRLAPAGQAVLDGYLAALFASPDGARPELLVIDTDLQGSVNAAYDAAVAAGAGLVIGPLSKRSVTDLAMRVERPVPLLALNRVDQVLPATGSALVQLSLAPEDEAATLAEIAFGSGHRDAMIVAPATAWGEKVERALRQRWAALGGRVVSAATYAEREEYSRSVKDGLGLSASEARARRVRDMLATNIEFTPRRREDPDVIFLLSADGAEARSIKPLLAFHYAGAIPVYALSSVYSGIPDERNRDLNGVNFIEMPWLLGRNPALRVTITAGDTGSDSYTRLNALGADAFLLQQNFARLSSGPDALLHGNTGLLSLDPQLRIHRELTPATFDGGAARPR